MSATPATPDSLILVHTAAASLALPLGAIQLLRRKGDRPHRLLGWCWTLAMAAAALTSFGIASFMPVIGDFGPIHALSLVILACLVIAIRAARAGNIPRHRGYLRGAYAGLVGAGIGTLAPGRLINGWLFG